MNADQNAEDVGAAKKKVKDWSAIIPETGGISINRCFPDDRVMLELLDIALKHIERQYPGEDFRLMPPLEMIRDFRGTKGFNAESLAVLAPMSNKVSYAVKALRNAIQDWYFRDTAERNPFKSGPNPGIHQGSAVSEVREYRDFVSRLRKLRGALWEARNETDLDLDAQVEEQELDAQLRDRVPLIWALRRGYSLGDLRRFLGEFWVGKGKLARDARVRLAIQAEVCLFAEMAGMDVSSVRASVEPLLLGKTALAGSRGGYKGARPSGRRLEDGKEEATAIQKRYAKV